MNTELLKKVRNFFVANPAQFTMSYHHEAYKGKRLVSAEQVAPGKWVSIHEEYETPERGCIIFWGLKLAGREDLTKKWDADEVLKVFGFTKEQFGAVWTVDGHGGPPGWPEPFRSEYQSTRCPSWDDQSPRVAVAVRRLDHMIETGQ